jgi:anthranilate phosphoribosyltransferase
MDEISIYDKTHVIEINNSEMNAYEIDPKDYFICNSTIADIKVNNADQSLKMMLSVIKNKDTPARMISLLNAAALVYISGKSETISDAVKICENALKSKSVDIKVNELVKLTNSFENVK